MAFPGLAFPGLLLYSIPLMIGGTLNGLMWMDGTTFMESVTMMAPYWLWRADDVVGAYNFYRMVTTSRHGYGR